MARPPRRIAPGVAHHVCQRGLEGRPVFAGPDDERAYLEALREALAYRQLRLHGYLFGTAEVHLLLRPTQPEALSQALQDVGRRYVAGFNQRHGRTGTLWDGRFRAYAVQDGEPLLQVMAWMERRHAPGPAQDLLAWWASSAGHHLGLQRQSWVQDPAEYWALGNTPFERELHWRERLSHDLPDETAQLAQHLRSGEPLGSASFVTGLRQSWGLPALKRPRGRPRRASADAGPAQDRGS